jgi:hypothetical protein
MDLRGHKVSEREIIEVDPASVSVMLPASAILERSRAIHRIMKEAMRYGVDYGPIEGCGPKPCLMKPGAEKLLMMFQVAPRVSVTDLSTPPSVYWYRVIVSLVSQAGVYLGDGIGEATSLEHKWHDKKDGSTVNAPDVCNTILKMAKKRALVDAVLTVLGASDIFTQDVDDMEPAARQPERHDKPAAKPTASKDSDALNTAQLTWLEKNAPLVWTTEQLESWFAAHKVISYAELTRGDAKQLVKELTVAFEAITNKAAEVHTEQV